MKKIIFPVLVLILIIFISKKSDSITISVTLPSSTDPTINAYITTPANRATLADMLTAELYRRVGSWGSMSHIAMGMSNANANASGSGSLNGYQGYTIWAAAIGVMGSTQLKSYDISELSTVLNSFRETGDAYFGIGTGVSTNVGLHLGHFNKSLDGFYINLKLMYLPPIPIQLNSYGKISPSNITAGVEVNYQIIKRGKLIDGMFSWGDYLSALDSYITTII